MELHGIKFVMLGSTDVARSVAFYRDLLGLNVLQQFEGFAFVDGGGVAIGLSADLGERIARGDGFGGEVVFGAASVTAAYEELRAAGVEFEREPRAVNAEAWAATCKDPDGHAVTFYGAP